MAKSHSTSVGVAIRRNKELILFMAIPLAVIAVLAGVLLLPSLLAHPKYDFIYSACPTYGCDNNYRVTDGGRVMMTTSGYQDYRPSTAQLYYYSVSKQSSTPLSLDSAQQYTLNAANVSADGYVLTQGNAGGGDFFFFSSDGDYNWYLRSGMKHKRLNLVTPDQYDSRSISFVGWVNP